MLVGGLEGRTGEGTWYAKQNCPGQAFEASLMAVLAGISDGWCR